MEKAIIQEANVGLQESQYRQYFRKVYTNGNFKKTLKLGGALLYNFKLPCKDTQLMWLQPKEG